MKAAYLYIAFILFHLFGIAQNLNYKTLDYSEVDSWVRTLNSKKIASQYILARLIKERFTEQHLRLRANYTWLAENVSYDCYGFHHKSVARTSSSEVFKQKKSICSGYANLFKELCDLEGIECEIISGIAKSSSLDMGKKLPKKANHAWNRVKLSDEKWYLIDATWGAGFVDKDVQKFTKKFNDYFYLTPPMQFIYSHYPSNKQMQLLDKPISKNSFKYFPYVSLGIFKNQIVSIGPDKYHIKTEVGKTVSFTFSTIDNYPINFLGFYLEEKKQVIKDENDTIVVRRGIIELMNKNEEYAGEYIFHHPGQYYMTIYPNRLASFGYIVDVKSNKKMQILENERDTLFAVPLKELLEK
jgi:hypothetical protein